MTMKSRFSGQDGAVAVMTAVLAVALIGFAAFAVDLGNGFARKRMLQSQADLAALAGAGSLPVAAAAIQGATDYLIANEVIGSQDFASLTDGQRGNGEIIVKNKNTRIEVVTPPASVGVGLGRVLGQSDYDVQAVAEAEIRSPARILPFFIPAGCAAPAGEIVLKAGAKSEGGSPSITEPVFLTPSKNSKDKATVSSVTPLIVDPGLSEARVTVRGENYYKPVGTPPASKVMEIGFVQGDTQVVAEVTAAMVTLNTGAPTLDQIDFDLKATTNIFLQGDANTILASTGKWWVQVRRAGGSTNGNIQDWSSADNSKEAGFVFQIGPNTDPADECGEKQTGDFGLLDSPRADSGGSEIPQSQQRLDLNIARGIDHSVREYSGVLPPWTESDNCRVSPANQPIPGGVLDTFPNIGSAPNCMNIFNGNKVDSATDGLVLGGALDGGFDGRLAVPTIDGCSANLADPNSERNVIGTTINNDRLGCFIDLGNVQSLVNSSDPAATRITREIFDSPRFFFVPVLNFRVNPPNGYYPIVGWRAVFITNEYSGLTIENGIQASNSKLTEIKVVYFELNRLPAQIDGAGQETTDYLGEGPKIVVLVR